MALQAYQVLRGLDAPPSYRVAKNTSASLRLALMDGGEIMFEKRSLIVIIRYGDPLALRPLNKSEAVEMRDRLLALAENRLTRILNVDEFIVESANPIIMAYIATGSGANHSGSMVISMSFKLRLHVSGLPLYGPLGRALLTVGKKSFQLTLPCIRLEPLNRTVTLDFNKALENLENRRYLIDMGYFIPCNATIVEYWAGYYASPGSLKRPLPTTVIFAVENESPYSAGRWTVPVKAG